MFLLKDNRKFTSPGIGCIMIIMENIRALIIDDDKDTANLFRTILTLVGFECIAVYTARAALAHLAANDPDIVLLDMRLGLELDGGDILSMIRSNPRFDNTRVIVITAYPGMLEQTEKLADLVLLKPVELEDLQTLSSRLTQIRPRSQIFRDPVTKLYTLTFFMTRLEHAYLRSKRHLDVRFAVMAIQCRVVPKGPNRPPLIESEQLLRRVAEILYKDFRPTDTFCHLEGERIVALYEDLKSPEGIYSILHRLVDDFTKDLEARDLDWGVAPVIGAVMNDPSFKSDEEILKAAVNTLDRACQLKGERFLVGGPKDG